MKSKQFLLLIFSAFLLIFSHISCAKVTGLTQPSIFQHLKARSPQAGSKSAGPPKGSPPKGSPPSSPKGSPPSPPKGPPPSPPKGSPPNSPKGSPPNSRPPTPKEEPNYTTLSKASRAPGSFTPGTRYVFIQLRRGGTGAQCIERLGHYRLIVATYKQNGSRDFSPAHFWHLVQKKEDPHSQSSGSTGSASLRWGVDIAIKDGSWVSPPDLKEFTFSYQGAAKKSDADIRALIKAYEDENKKYKLFKVDCQQFAEKIAKEIT